MYGFAALSSPDFRETIAFAITYHQLAAPLMQVDFREERCTAAWLVAPLPYLVIEQALHAFIVKLHMAVFLSLHRKMMGPAFKPTSVNYALVQPQDDRVEVAFFGCPVLYGKPENRFVFDAAWLDRRPEFGNELVYAELKQLCDSLLREFQLGVGIAGQVRELILSNLSRPVGFEQVARCLNMSGRSLRRRLQEEGTSFGQLTDELRVQVAIRYVQDTDRSVEDIAFALGFSDAASFRQAFRRWTNATPRAYRKAKVDNKR
jgi:AraC-like DNA-binding protein